MNAQFNVEFGNKGRRLGNWCVVSNSNKTAEVWSVVHTLYDL